MNFISWNLSNPAEGIPRWLWRRLVVGVTGFSAGSTVLAIIMLWQFLSPDQKTSPYMLGTAMVWLLFSLPFLLWFKYRYQQRNKT